MKTRTIYLSAALSLGCLSFGILEANTIGYVEKFSLAQDRDEALKQLIPGTRDYYYYHALHAQHRGDQQELKRVLGLWVNRHGHTSRVKEIRNRRALLDFEKNPNTQPVSTRRRLVSMPSSREPIGTVTCRA